MTLTACLILRYQRVLLCSAETRKTGHGPAECGTSRACAALRLPQTKQMLPLTDLSASLASLSWRLLAMQAAMTDATSMVLFFSLSSAFQALLLALMSSICCTSEEDGKRI